MIYMNVLTAKKRYNKDLFVDFNNVYLLEKLVLPCQAIVKPQFG